MKQIGKIGKNIFSLMLCVCLLKLGFGQQVITGSIVHNDSTRGYHLCIPASYSEDVAVPLILDLHWYGGNGQLQMWTSSFGLIADTVGFITVHPNGLVNDDTVPHWSVGHWIGSSSDDVSFLSALIDTIADNYSIDLDRVYSTGLSNGGFMSFHLACHLSDRIAAIASVAGSMTPYTYDACNPIRPVPILHIHGTKDSGVVIQGNSWSKPVRDVLDYWIDNNNCVEIADTFHFYDEDTINGITVDHIKYGQGDMGVSVEYLKVIGGGHKWWNNDDLHTNVEVWKFFSKYDIKGLIGCEPTSYEERDAIIIKSYPNPAQTKVTFELSIDERTTNLQGNLVIEIFNSQGQLIHEEYVDSRQNSLVDIDIARLKEGLYVFRCGDTVGKINVLR